MPVDKFGRMSDLKTKDTGVSLTYINNNYVRSDGETPLTGSLDMRGNTLYNVADPVNPQDVVTKVYVDNTKGSGVIGRKTKDGVSIKENLDFLGKQKIKNLPDPVNDHDVVTKEYVDTTTAPFLKLDQTKYNTKGDIDMEDQFTVLNVKTPIDDNHITNKKYVDDQIKFISAFSKRSVEGYEAKGPLYLRRNKILGLPEPLQPGEPTTKKYVDGVYNNLLNQFVDADDNILPGKNVDMEGNQILGLPEPATDQEPATKKYVDDLQTQNVDEKGNIKFGRSINLDRNRIFSMKEPTKPSEGANKKYVDDTITKRLQEEKDNFLPQDPATKEYVDEAIKQVAGGDILVSKEGVFIKANGHYRATASLDIDNHKMENLPDPVDEKDAVNKKYIDGIVENLTLKQGLIRENGGFNLVDSYINMNFNRVRNIPYPHHNEDAVPRSFVDNIIKEVEEKIKKRKHLIAVHTKYCGPLKSGDYPFKFGGGDNIENCDEKIHDWLLNHRIKGVINGFVMPHSGRIKKIICESLTFLDKNKIIDKLINKFNQNQIKELKRHFGKEDFKNDLLKTIFNKINFTHENNEKKESLFNIVKFKKILTKEEENKPSLFGLFNTNPIIQADYVIKKFTWLEIEVDRNDYILTVMKTLNNETIPLNEGETINIRIISNNKYQTDLIDDFIDDIKTIHDIFNLTIIRLLGELNFNFTFLIELDPL